MGKQRRYVKDIYRDKSNKDIDIIRYILLIKNRRLSNFQFRVLHNLLDILALKIAMCFKISNCQFSFLEMTKLFGHGSIVSVHPEMR